MFKGTTVVRINAATMHKALEDHLNAQLAPGAPKQKVTSIATAGSAGPGGYTTQSSFDVSLSEVVEPPAPDANRIVDRPG